MKPTKYHEVGEESSYSSLPDLQTAKDDVAIEQVKQGPNTDKPRQQKSPIWQTVLAFVISVFTAALGYVTRGGSVAGLIPAVLIALDVLALLFGMALLARAMLESRTQDEKGKVLGIPVIIATTVVPFILLAYSWPIERMVGGAFLLISDALWLPITIGSIIKAMSRPEMREIVFTTLATLFIAIANYVWLPTVIGVPSW